MSIVYPLTPPAIAGIGPQDFTLALENAVGENISPFTFGEQEFLWPGDMFTIDANLPPMPYTQAEQWWAFLNSLFGKFGTFLMGDYNRPTPQGAMSGPPLVSGTNPSGSNQLNLRGAAASVANWAVAGDYIQATQGTPEVETATLEAITETGVQDVSVYSVDAMAAGQFLSIDTGVNQETVEVLSVPGDAFQANFTKTHASDVPVVGAVLPTGPQRIYKVLQNASTDSGGNVSLQIRPSLRETLDDGTAIVTTNCAGTFRLTSNKSPAKIDKNRMYTISFKAREANLT